MTSKIPRGIPLPAETKAGHKPESRDTAAVPSVSGGVLKSQKENLPRKNVAPKVQKGASTRYGQQAELKEQNQHLMTVNEQLERTLSEKERRIAELEMQCFSLTRANAELQRNLQNCYAVLVNHQIDPVSGDGVGDAAQENGALRAQTVNLSRERLAALQKFGDLALQHHARIQQIRERMGDLHNSRDKLAQERETVSLEAASMESSLKTAEAYLH